MKAPTKVSSTVEKADLDKALRKTGKTKSETIRIALRQFIGESGVAAPRTAPPNGPRGAAARGAPRAAAPTAPRGVAARGVPGAVAAVAPLGGKPQSDMSNQELSDCEDVLFRAEEGINNAIVLLKMKAANPNPPPGVDAVEETARLNIIIADLEKQVFDISQKINAIDAGNLTMTPPTSAAITTISKLADSVGRMTAEAQDADTIITVAKQLAGSIKGLEA